VYVVKLHVGLNEELLSLCSKPCMLVRVATHPKRHNSLTYTYMYFTTTSTFPSIFKLLLSVVKKECIKPILKNLQEKIFKGGEAQREIRKRE
jgi:hypothetical protein